MENLFAFRVASTKQMPEEVHVGSYDPESQTWVYVDGQQPNKPPEVTTTTDRTNFPRPTAEPPFYTPDVDWSQDKINDTDT